MEATKNTPAIIISRQPYRESDSLVTVYTLNFGKLNLLARGTKKSHSKLAGHLEPISLVDIMIIAGRGFDYIGAAAASQIYSGLRQDLNKLFFAGSALRLFNHLVKEGENDERLFYLLINWLDILDNYQTTAVPLATDTSNIQSSELSRPNGELLFAFFAIKLLGELGYSPELSECLRCHRQITAGHNYLDLQNGGLICGECYAVRSDNSPAHSGDYPIRSANSTISDQTLASSGLELLTISDDCIKLWRFLANNKFELAPKLKLNHKLIKELSTLINGFLSFRD